MINDRFL